MTVDANSTLTRVHMTLMRAKFNARKESVFTKGTLLCETFLILSYFSLPVVDESYFAFGAGCRWFESICILRGVAQLVEHNVTLIVCYGRLFNYGEYSRGADFCIVGEFPTLTRFLDGG